MRSPLALIRRVTPLLAVLLLALQAWAQPITREEKEEVLTSLGEIVTRRAFVPGVDMGQWPTFLEKHRESIDKAEQQEPFVRAVNGALRNFGLSHLRMRSPTSTRQRETNSTVGLGIGTAKEEDKLVVVEVYPQGPAAEVGLQIGDQIVAVDGNRPGEPGELRGEEGTEVTLKIARADGTEAEVKITRRQFTAVRLDSLRWLDEETAVLKVNTFARGYDREQIEKLMEEAAGKARHLIVDLRSNGGGATNNLRHFLSELLPPNTVIGTFVSRRAMNEYVKAGEGDGTDVVALAKWWPRKFRTSRDAPGFDGKIVVLINRGSASASEIAAAALSEIAGARLVGSRTAGAVLASVYGRLPHGFSVQYPIDDYVTAQGVRLEKNPREPDKAVTTRRGGPDLAMDKAAEVVRAMAVAAAGKPAEGEAKSVGDPANSAEGDPPADGGKPATDGAGEAGPKTEPAKTEPVPASDSPKRQSLRLGGVEYRRAA
ncbi:MAG: S41 family peptidase [Phycisphaerales bacterium]